MAANTETEAITEKQRVSLPITLWLSLVGIIVTGAGAWFATSARASSAAEGVVILETESREHDRRIQRLEDTGAFTKEMLERLDKKLDRVLRKEER